jgi:hypothetical protein
MSDNLAHHLGETIEVLELYAIHLRAVIEEQRRPAADGNRATALWRYYDLWGEEN